MSGPTARCDVWQMERSSFDSGNHGGIRTGVHEVIDLIGTGNTNLEDPTGIEGITIDPGGIHDEFGIDLDDLTGNRSIDVTRSFHTFHDSHRRAAP